MTDAQPAPKTVPQSVQDVAGAQDALLSHEDGAESAFEDEGGEQGPDGTEIA